MEMWVATHGTAEPCGRPEGVVCLLVSGCRSAHATWLRTPLDWRNLETRGLWWPKEARRSRRQPSLAHHEITMGKVLLQRRRETTQAPVSESLFPRYCSRDASVGQLVSSSNTQRGRSTRSRPVRCAFKDQGVRRAPASVARPDHELHGKVGQLSRDPGAVAPALAGHMSPADEPV